jgi:alkaline phosphatase D
MLWTRVSVDRGRPADVTWRVARDARLHDIVASGSVVADAEGDHTVHVDVDGLESGSHYWYEFEHGGERSTVGRTRTLPDGHFERLRFAQCSCAKFNSGYFNSYARIADRDDLAFVLHLGDYIYEASETPPAGQTPGADIGRPFDPRNECMTLADYRTRYAQYHADPDAQRMHATHPVIATVDDHEFADGAWRDGSDEHHEERDGPWADRKAAAFRAHWEWTPSRPPDPTDPSRIYRSMRLGDLATLILIDTRTRRDQPVRGEAMRAPDRTQLGHEQREWLLDEIAGARTRWVLLGNGSMMSPLWRDGAFTPNVLPGLLSLKLIHKMGDGPDVDQWDGYPAERERIIEAIGERQGDVLVLSGDIHCGVAAELSRDPFDEHAPVAAEFVTMSITSQNLDDKMGWPARATSLPIEQELLGVWPHVRFLDVDSHGYVLVDVKPDAIVGAWWAVEGVLQRSEREWLDATWMVRRGEPALIELPDGGSTA